MGPQPGRAAVQVALVADDRAQDCPDDESDQELACPDMMVSGR